MWLVLQLHERRLSAATATGSPHAIFDYRRRPRSHKLAGDSFTLIYSYFTLFFLLASQVSGSRTARSSAPVATHSLLAADMKRRIDHGTAGDSANAAAVATAIAAIAADKALYELDHAALNYAFVSMLGNADMFVRNEAVATLSKFGRYGDWLVPMSHVIGNLAPAILASHPGFTESMHSMLEGVHPEPGRWSAIGLIFKCAEAAMHTPPMLSPLCTAFTSTLLTDEIRGLSSPTANLTNLTLNAHITTIVGRLADPDTLLRNRALDDLGAFHPDKLTSHLGSIVGLLANPIPAVRSSALFALCFFNRTTRIAHIHAIVSMLTDSKLTVRCSALSTLGDLGYVALAPYVTDIANAILYMLVDPDADVRYNSLHAFYKRVSCREAYKSTGAVR